MPINFSEARIQELTNTALSQTAARLQINPAEITPVARTEVEQRVRQSLEVEASRLVSDISETQARLAVTPDQGAQLGLRVKEQLTAGLGMVNLISEDAQYIEIVKKNAQMLKIKLDAFVEVGFTADQAFRLIEVEFMGKASARIHVDI
jgi:hypothetical protein